MRAAIVLLTAAVIVLTACPPENESQDAAGLVSEADSLRCGQIATLYTNHTVNPKDLHVRVKNGCTEEGNDTIPPVPARLRVLDARGQVVQNQDISIPGGTTHRGTLTVPGGSKLQLECSDRTGGPVGCTWSYSYALP